MCCTAPVFHALVLASSLQSQQLGGQSAAYGAHRCRMQPPSPGMQLDTTLSILIWMLAMHESKRSLSCTEQRCIQMRLSNTPASF